MSGRETHAYRLHVADGYPPNRCSSTSNQVSVLLSFPSRAPILANYRHRRLTPVTFNPIISGKLIRNCWVPAVHCQHRRVGMGENPVPGSLGYEVPRIFRAPTMSGENPARRYGSGKPSFHKFLCFCFVKHVVVGAKYCPILGGGGVMIHFAGVVA
ncbi:hypothetical protein Hdeb2414_s0003g00101261 [Helianthus debilis subsp. tardiflorus]